MKRFAFILLALGGLLLWIPASAHAQTPTGSQIVIEMSDKDAKFRVDGQIYTGRVLLTWPAGSKHSLEFYVNNEDGNQYTGAGRTRFAFGSWSENTTLATASGSSTSAVVVTADPRVNRYLGSVSKEHLVDLVMFDGRVTPPGQPQPVCSASGNAPQDQLRVGVVTVNGVCFWNNASFWTSSTDFNLNAYPFPGFVFVGWGNSSSSQPDPFVKRVILEQGGFLHARFAAAKRVKFRTSPPGLKIRVDRQEHRTTEIEPCESNNYQLPIPHLSIPLSCIGEFDFVPGSTHVIGGISPQIDKTGRAWVFDKFSNGGGQDSAYIAGTDITNIDTVIGEFKRGVTMSVSTRPAGLKIRINGRDNWPENYFVFLPGSVHSVAAPLEQTDPKGRKYQFKRWSNGGSAAQEVTLPDNPDTTFHLTAEYEPMNQLVILSTGTGGHVLVDGEPCQTPCRVNRPAGAEVQLEAPEITPVSADHRLVFDSWSDGGPRTRNIALTAEVTTLQLSQAAHYRLLAASDPPDGARITIDPVSPDGFYAAGTSVLVTVAPAPGHRFRRWDFDLAGTSTISTVEMSRPKSLLARLDKIPFIPPAGIRNAASPNVAGPVAPGSLIFIEGSDLAPYFEAGPQGPILAQAIARTSVLAGGRILSLISVSPQRIHAQLPRDIEPGEHEIRVVRAGHPDVTGTFQVSASAPGLFSRAVDSQDFGQAFHADGSPVTAESPARPGETITLQGTGFGRYKMAHPEGFALPPAPDYPLLFEVQVESGDAATAALWAGGLAGRIGIDCVKFKVPDGASGALKTRVVIEGAASNSVIVPVTQKAQADTH